MTKNIILFNILPKKFSLEFHNKLSCPIVNIFLEKLRNPFYNNLPIQNAQPAYSSILKNHSMIIPKNSKLPNIHSEAI